MLNQVRGGRGHFELMTFCIHCWPGSLRLRFGQACIRCFLARCHQFYWHFSNPGMNRSVSTVLPITIFWLASPSLISVWLLVILTHLPHLSPPLSDYKVIRKFPLKPCLTWTDVVCFNRRIGRFLKARTEMLSLINIQLSLQEALSTIPHSLSYLL